jgi:transposase
MVEDVRSGSPMRVVARKFKVTLSTVQRWVARAGDNPLDVVDWNSRRSGSRESRQRTLRGLEKRVLRLRKELKTKSALGEYGAAAIRRELELRGGAHIPSVRTIGRILSRNGALDGRRRRRHSAPPPGWYLLPVAQRELELDSFDMIEDLVIRGGQDVNVLTGISLHGGLCMAWPHAQITSKITVDCVLDHWREWGLPAYAKFDNDTVFQGTHR